MNNNQLLEGGHPSSLEQQVIMAVALSHSIVGEADENSTKIFLSRFVRKNLKGKILNDVSVNRFNVLLYQAKTARLTEDDLGVLLLIVEVFLKNMHNLIVYEELQAPLKISFANIFGLMRMCLKRITEGTCGDSSSVKKILSSILNILQRAFKLQSYSAASSQEKVETDKILSIIEKSKVCDALSASFGNARQDDQVEYESSILVVDGSAGREISNNSSAVSQFTEDLIFCEDIASERILRNVSGFMQAGSEFLTSLESCVLSLIKLNTEHATNHLLLQILSQLVSAKKASDAESIAKLVKNAQGEVLRNPQTLNLDLLLKVLTDNTIQVHLTAYDKLQLFCCLIEGLGKISIDQTQTTLDELLTKVQQILKNYSESMNLTTIEKDIKQVRTQEVSLSFVKNLFGNSYLFMANMSKIEEEILKADKVNVAAAANGKAQKKQSANSMEVEDLSNLGLVSDEVTAKQSAAFIEKSEKPQSLGTEEDIIPEEKVELNKKSSAANVEQYSKASRSSSKGDGAVAGNGGIEASKTTKHNGHKWFEETSKIVQHLYAIFRSLSENQSLVIPMTQCIDFQVIQELIVQIKQFSNRDKQISGYLTKIILVFISKHTIFSEKSLTQFSSFMTTSFLAATSETFINEISSIYMKIYLSIAATPAVNQINEALLQALLSDESDKEFRNYHMILLNLLCLQVNQDVSKHAIIVQSILSSANIRNKNILQILLILYNLLVPVSSQILVNKSKAIFLDLLQGMPAAPTSNHAKGTNNEKQSQDQSAGTKGLLAMSDPVNVNAFVTITDSANVKTLKHTLKGMFKGISELSTQSKQQFCQLITSINTNMGVLLNRQSESVQLIYCLVIELNQIACTMCPDEFKKSTLQDEFELISRVNSFKSLSGILALFSQSIAVENSPTSGLIAVLLRVSQLAKADQEMKSKQQSQQSQSSQMVVEIDESQSLSAKRVITECLKKMKDLYNQTELHREAAIELIFFGKKLNNTNPSRLLEKQVLLWLMKEHSWTGGNSSIESINEIEKVDGLFEKINTETNGETALAILQLLSNRLNGAIDQAVNNLNIQLQSSTQPQYVSHLLSLVSHPLSWVRPQLAKQLESQPEMLEHINRFLLPRLALKLSPQFYMTLLALTDGGQAVENQRNITEEILLDSIFQSDALYRSEQSKDSFEAFFNTDGCKFNEYFRRNSSEILLDYEKQAFMHVLNKFNKYTRQAAMITEILSAQEKLSEFVKSALTYCISNTVSEVKQSPLNLKAICLAFSQECQIESACNANLLKLCKKVAENQGNNRTTTTTRNLLVDLLLCYPNRQADGLLIFAGLKGINLKDQLWFPVSELAQICFASSDVESQYDLEGSQQPQALAAKSAWGKSKPQSSQFLPSTAASNHIFDTIAQQKQKVLNQMKSEQSKQLKDAKKVLQAFERLNNEKYITLDADIQKVNYETNKNLFYNTEHIANFKTLRSLFTKSFLQCFTASTNPALLHGFIHDCEISLNKITLSDSEDKNRIIKAPFLQLMRLFEVLLKESLQMVDHVSGKQILCQAVDIVDTIVQQTQELIEESYLNDDFTGLSPILAYNCERIIQVTHFIFTNSIKLMQLTDLTHLVKQIFAFALSLPPLNNQTASKYSVQLLLMLVLHVRQASNLEIKSGSSGNGEAQTQVISEQTQQQQQQSSVLDLQAAQLVSENQQPQDIPNPDKMECEKSREELIQEIDKKLNCLPKEIASSNCTLVKHHNKAEMQPFYKCHTCGIADIKYVVCAWCAYTCHNGHDLAFYKQTKGTCDCSDKGPEGQCKAKGLKKDLSNMASMLCDSPRDPNSSKPLDGLFASFENHNIPHDLVSYIMKNRTEKSRIPLDESAFNYERKQGAFQFLQDERDDMTSEINEQLAMYENEEEEEKKDFDIFSQESDVFHQIEGIYDAARNAKKDKDSIKKKKITKEIVAKKGNSQEVQLQQPQQQQLIVQGNQQQQSQQLTALQGILSELCSSSVCGSVLSEVETQLSQIVPKWDIYSQPNTQSSALQSNTVIDFLSSPIDYSQNKNMDNTLAKIICRLVKPQGIDMAIREEQFPEANYYLMQGAYGQQSISPMTIRKPIDHNNQELVIVATGSRVVLMEKTKLFSKITEQLKGQVNSNNPDDAFASAANKVIQMAHWDIFSASPLQLEFTVMHVRFSPKNPLLAVIAGLTQMVIAKVSEDNRISKISAIPQKSLGDYINKVLWLPFSEQYLVVMNLRCVKLLQVKQEGGSSVLIKFNSNESSGIFKDFLVTSHPTQPNEYVLLVACADGRVYYSEFNTQQREEITLTTYINLPSELIPKGQVCMGLSFSETSLIMSVSYKNGVNIFGRLDLKTHQLTNAFAYKPLSSHNKNGLLQFIERSGEIMANSNEIHVDESQSIHITTLRDPNNQSNYSIHSGFLTAIKLSKSSIQLQPVATSLVKLSEDHRCEGYCFVKNDKLEGVTFVVSLHDDGSMNMYGIPTDGTSAQQVQKVLVESAQPAQSGNNSNGKGIQLEANPDLSEQQQLDKAAGSTSASDPSLKILTNELKLTDLSKTPVLQVDFADKATPLKYDRSAVVLEVNKVKQNELLFNEKNNVIISKSEPQEITLSGLGTNQILIGVRVRMQMSSNTGQGIYKCSVLNRECKLLNCSTEDKKMLDIPLSNLESIYVYLHQNSLKFTLSSFNSVSTSLKMASAHEIKIISIEPYGLTTTAFQLKEKLESLKSSLNIRSLSSAQADPIISAEQLQQTEEVLIEQLADTTAVQSVDYIARRDMLSAEVPQQEVLGLVNQLDILTLTLSTNNTNNTLESSNLTGASGYQLALQKSTGFSSERIKSFISQLKVLLVRPTVNGKPSQLLLSSVKRALKSALILLNDNSELLTHPYNYTSFKMYARVEHFLAAVQDQKDNGNNNLTTLSFILKLLIRLIPSRVSLLYAVFGLYPNLLASIIDTFIGLLKGDFDQTECQVIVAQILKINIQYFKFLRDKHASKSNKTETTAFDVLSDPAADAFAQFERLLKGIQQSNMKAKLLDIAKEYLFTLKNESNAFTSEDNAMQSSTAVTFGFDVFNIDGIAIGGRHHKVPKKPTKDGDNNNKNEKNSKLSKDLSNSNSKYSPGEKQLASSSLYGGYQNSESQSKNNQDQGRYDGKGSKKSQPVEEFDHGMIFQGFDALSEEEMLKLAIEMSLQDKSQNNNNTGEQQQEGQQEQQQLQQPLLQQNEQQRPQLQEQQEMADAEYLLAQQQQLEQFEQLEEAQQVLKNKKKNNKNKNKKPHMIDLEEESNNNIKAPVADGQPEGDDGDDNDDDDDDGDDNDDDENNDENDDDYEDFEYEEDDGDVHVGQIEGDDDNAAQREEDRSANEGEIEDIEQQYDLDEENIIEEEQKKQSEDTKDLTAANKSNEMEVETGNNTNMPQSFEQIKATTVTATINQQDPSLFVVLQLLNRLDLSHSNTTKASIAPSWYSDELLNVYCFMVSQLLIIQSNQQTLSANLIANIIYSLFNNGIENSQLQSHSSVTAKIFIFTAQLVQTLMRVPGSEKHTKEQQQLLQASNNDNNEDCEEISREFSQIYMGSHSNNNNSSSAGLKKGDDSKKAASSAISAEGKSSSSSKKDIYKTLREILKAQLAALEGSKSISYLDRAYELVGVMLKHFEGNKSSLRIEYANGEVVEVVSRVTLKKPAAVLISECQRDMEVLGSNIQQVMQVSDQVQFENTLNLVYALVTLDSQLLPDTQEQKWTVLLSECLVSPTAQKVSSDSAEKLLQLLAKTVNKYHDMRDCISLRKNYEILIRVMKETSAFSEVSYEQLVVIDHSLKKCEAIALTRRQNWSKFCEEKQDVFAMLYDIAFKDVRGQVGISYRLLSLYYQPLVDFSKYA